MQAAHVAVVRVLPYKHTDKWSPGKFQDAPFHFIQSYFSSSPVEEPVEEAVLMVVPALPKIAGAEEVEAEAVEVVLLVRLG